MPPEHARAFGGGAAETTLAPLVLVLLVVDGVLLLLLPRKYVVIPFLFLTFLIPLENSVVLGGAHFFVSRIIILITLARLLFGSKDPDGFLAGGFNSIDRAYFWCTAFQACAVIILFRDGGAIVNQFGFLIDSIGGYWILRSLIRTNTDISRVLKCLAFVSFVFGVCMVIEQVAFTNLFHYLGGLHMAPEIRDGRIRSQAAFQHPLLAGTVGGTVLPLFLLLWQNAKARVTAVLGIAGATLMTLTANSSSPFLAYAAGLLALCLWPLRGKMRMVRWGLVAALLGLALVMKAPVWFLIAHIDLTGSSSGYHRAALIDQFVNHLGDWWLVGVKDTGTWGWDLWDAQNEYVNVGETGGLAAFILFIVLLVRCFRSLGSARKAIEGDRDQEWSLWFLGAALFAHLVAFFGVNYFDQSRVNWFALLAIISAMTGSILRPDVELKQSPQLVRQEDKPSSECDREAAYEWWAGPTKYLSESR